jgi:hypothetical protein
MRKLLLLAALLTAMSGCSLNDALFGMFGTYHSDGYSRSDRERNFQQSPP